MKTKTTSAVFLVVSKRVRNSLPVPPFCRKSLTMSTAPFFLALNASAAAMKFLKAVKKINEKK
jgi:hypothetical protein